MRRERAEFVAFVLVVVGAVLGGVGLVWRAIAASNFDSTTGAWVLAAVGGVFLVLGVAVGVVSWVMAGD